MTTGFPVRWFARRKRPTWLGSLYVGAVLVLLLLTTLVIGTQVPAAAPRVPLTFSFPHEAVSLVVSTPYDDGQVSSALNSLGAGGGPTGWASSACGSARVVSVTCALPASPRPLVSGLTSWINVTKETIGAPSVRGYGTMVYDPLDNYVLLFGGITGTPSSLATLGGGTALGDTWVYQDGTWTNLTTNQTPGPRELAQMAYDPADKEVVMFAGEFSGGGKYWGYADTWTFVHGQWHNITSNLTNAPSGRFRGGLSYDYHDGYLLLFGGTNGNALTLYENDTWKFFHNSWTKLSVSGNPPGRSRFVMTYDPTDQEMVVYGGTTSLTPGSDTWVYANLTWTNATQSIAPPARLYYLAATDPALGGVLLYGGSTASGSGTAFYDTWLFKNGNWSQLTSRVNGSAGPLGYGFLAYDPDGSYVVLFGGFTNTYLVNATYTFGVNVTVFARSTPHSTDLGGNLTLAAIATPLSSNLTYGYAGLPTGCSPSTGASFKCTPTAAGTFNFSANATSSTGSTDASYVPVPVYADPAVSVPTGSPKSNLTDVGESTKFTVNATFGSGGFAFVWSGLPKGCQNATKGSFTCKPGASGTFNITVTATDSNGFKAGPNGTLRYTIDPSPKVVTPTSNRTSADVGQTVKFSTSASSGSGGYSYAWSNLPSGCSGTTATISCTVKSSTTAAISVTVTDSNGGSITSSSLNFTVYADPSGVSVSPSAASADIGQSVTFSAAYSCGSGGWSYSWSGLPSGCSASNSASISCNVTTAQTTSIGVKMTDSNGYSASSGSLNYTVYSDPTVSTPTSNRSSSDIGQSLNLSVTASSGSGGYSYRWSSLPSGCSSLNASSLVCTPTSVGTFTVSVVLKDSNLVSALTASNLTVVVLSDPTTSTPIANRSSADVGQAVALSTTAGSGSGSYTFTWTGLMPGCGGLTASISCRPTSAGEFFVTVVVKDTNGFSNSSSALVFTVYPDPSVTTPVPNRPSADVGQALSISTTPSNGSGGYTYAWSNLPTGCSGTTAYVSCIVSAAATSLIVVAVTDSNGATTLSKPLSFTVYPDPTVSHPVSNRARADVGQDLSFAANETEVGAGGDVLNWSSTGAKSGGLTCTPSASVLLVCLASGPGSYAVRLTITDQNGGVGYALSANVTVLTDPTVGTPRLTAATTDVNLSITATVTAAGGSGGFSYSWEGLPSGCAGTGASITCYPTQSGTFHIVVTVMDSNGFAVTSTSITLRVSPALSISESGPTGEPSAGQNVPFSATATGGTGQDQYTWLFGDGARATGATVSYVFPHSGTFMVWLWVNDTVGGSISRHFVVIVRPAPASTFLGIPSLEGYAVIGAVLAAIVLLAALALVRRRRPPAPGGPDDPRSSEDAGVLPEPSTPEDQAPPGEDLSSGETDSAGEEPMPSPSETPTETYPPAQESPPDSIDDPSDF
jgi:hypothetical protein